MTLPTKQELLTARAHFGHLSSKWHSNMAPFILMKRQGIHFIDVNQTRRHLLSTAEALKQVVQSGKQVMFVATKRQAKNTVEQIAQKLGQPYVTERWLGGTLTNFVTIRKSLKKLANLHKNTQGEAYQNLTKHEKLIMTRQQNKLEKVFKGLQSMNRLPEALFIVDINREHLAVKEAKKLHITLFALVDTNANPELVDHLVPVNDDAASAIDLTMRYIEHVMKQGINKWEEQCKTRVMAAPTAGSSSATATTTTTSCQDSTSQQSSHTTTPSKPEKKASAIPAAATTSPENPQPEASSSPTQAQYKPNN